MAILLISAGSAGAANKYWVGDAGGGNFNWSTAANWSASSGGADGAVPVAGDVVIFDANSTNADNTVDDLAIGAAGITIQASIAGVGITVNTTLPLAAQTITMNAGPIFFGGAGQIQLAGDVTMAVNAGVAMTLGIAIDTNGHYLTINTNIAMITISGAISGAGGLTKGGPGDLQFFANTYSYTGKFTVNQGRVFTADAGATIPDNSEVVIGDDASAQLRLMRDEVVGSLSGGGASGGRVNTSGYWLTVNQSADRTFAGSIDGGGNLRKDGAGKLTLTGVISSIGTVYIHVGTLETSGAERIDNGSYVTLDGTSVFSLGGAETIGNLSGLATNNILLGANTLTVTQTGDMVFAGGISGVGGALVKNGGAKLTLSGANTYTGATTVNTGTLSLQNAAAAGTADGGVTVAAGASLELQGGIAVGAEALTLNAGAGNELVNVSGSNSWAGAVTLAGGAVDVVITANDLNIGGAVGGAGGLAKSGAGTLTLSGANTYAGATSISAGNLGTSGNERIPDGSDVTLSGTGALTIGGTETIHTLAGSAGTSIALGANALAVVQEADQTFAGVIGGVGGMLVKSGGSKLTLSGTNTYTGPTMISIGTLSLQNAAAAGAASGGVTVSAGASLELDGGLTFNGEALTLDSGAGSELVSINGANIWNGAVTLAIGAVDIVTTGDLTLGGVIDGGGGLAKSGAGILVLSGTNTYPGAVAVNEGVLNLQNDTAAGATSGGVTVAAGASLELQGGIAVGAEALTLNAGAGDELVSVSGSNSWGGPVTLAGGNVDIGVSANDLTLSGIMDGAGGGINKLGAGKLILSGTNTYAGPVTVAAGTLNLRNAAATGDPAGGVTMASGASLELQGDITVGAETLTLNGDGGAALELISLSGNNTWGGPITLATGAVDISAAAGTLTLDSTVGGNQDLILDTIGNIVVTGAIGTGTGTVTKNSAGILTLNGANTYTGATTVNDGTINLNGISTGASAVTINNAATLAGTGTIPGSVEMNNTAVLSPGGNNGVQVGTITITGNLTFNNTSKFLVTMNAGAIDKLIVNGSLTAGPGRNIEFQPGYQFIGMGFIPATIMTVNGAYTAFANGLPAGYDIDATKSGNLIRLIAYPAAVIPTLSEWGAIILLLLIAGTGIVSLRRQRRTA